MESLEEQELVVVVQIEEPTSPLICEQTDGDNEITDTKFIVTLEEDSSVDDKTNIIQQTSIDKSTEGQLNSETETPNNIDNVNIETSPSNMHINSEPTTTSNIIESSNDETSRKRSQEDSKGAENKAQDDIPIDINKRQKVELFTDHTGPEWYNVKGNLVTRAILSKNLPKLYESLPIYGRPENNANLDKFHSDKLREFIGPAIDEDEFEELSKYCSPERLKTGHELVVKSTLPSPGMLSSDDSKKIYETKANLCTLKKCKMRTEKDVANSYSMKLKYRGVRLIPLSQDDDKYSSPPESDDVMLEPGKDIFYRIRLYRPYVYTVNKERCTRGRHSVFSCDMVCAGRVSLAALRDRVVCCNDVDMRVDLAHAPHVAPPTTAKEVFPSGFLFINNVFYVDGRPGCKDHSRVIREWAQRRGMGEFPVRDMATATLDDVLVRLGHPEVYVHQGNCEHVFTFSEIRLLSSSDPLRLSSYPRHSAVSQHQTIYCTTCAEFGAKWIVVGCSRVPFDPAFFCDTCFKQYLYIDGVKIGDFKAYSYRGNETNTLKPCF